ncbi:MAG TPA: sulfate adenylyltransferase subunit CysN [Tepidisphaeraceae bacterium]|nr:sulfate adenylyltransferase subunit CysN [Tepidisphaeraceae bacterium]
MDTPASNVAELLQQEQNTSGLLRLVTAGSVDDGKSTLIGRLLFESKGIFEDQLEAVQSASTRRGSAGGQLDLSLVTDGLKAEREQGITIDVAYRYFATPRRKFIIADTPGHEQYTRNMVTGASTADLVIILLDARQGVVTQSRRHAFLASLLGIKHMVVAVNKMDLVGYERAPFERIVADFTEFSTRLDVPDVTFIPMSALVGDNVTGRTRNMPWYEGAGLLHHLETVHIASDRNLIDFRFPVQLVSRPDLHFRGYMGTPASGIVRPGQDVVSLPSGVRSRVVRVIGPNGDVPEGFPPMAITLTLADEIDVSRGDVLVHPNNIPRVNDTVEAMVVWMAKDPLIPGKQYVIKHGTRKVPGFAKAIRYRVDVNSLRQHAADALALNEIGRCVLELSRPIVYDAYARNRASGSFIVIDRETHNTVGAGMLLDRERLDPEDAAAAPAPAHAVRPARASHRVSEIERRGRLKQQPLCVWISGTDPADVAAIAYVLERALFDAGMTGYVLRGDDDRCGGDPMRLAESARLLCDAGLFVVCATSTGQQIPGFDRIKQAVGADWMFAVAMGESPAGPPDPDVRLAATLTPEAAVEQVIRSLQGRGWIP